MDHPSRPLPFPVHDRAGVKRAVTYTAKSDAAGRARLQRFVAQRAHDLGCSDLIPSSWQNNRPMITSSTTGLDRQLELKSIECGISLAKLKTVYFRGVDEYHAAEYDMGTPSMWGLARVQRFVNGVTSGAPLTDDQDLVTSERYESNPSDGIDIAIDASDILTDFLYSSGDALAQKFAPGEVNEIRLEDEVIYVTGTLDERPWVYTLNTVTGEHQLAME